MTVPIVLDVTKRQAKTLKKDMTIDVLFSRNITCDELSLSLPQQLAGLFGQLYQQPLSIRSRGSPVASAALMRVCYESGNKRPYAQYNITRIHTS